MKENTTCEWDDGGKIGKIIIKGSMFKLYYTKYIVMQT